MSEEKVRLLGLLLAAGTAVLAAWLALSILFRLVTGKGLGARAPKGAILLDARAWGRSLKSELTEARGVTFPLLVALTADALVVRARFPASLFFLPQVFDLEHEVARDAVSAELVRDSYSHPALHVSSGALALELHLRHAAALAAALPPPLAEPANAPAAGVLA